MERGGFALALALALAFAVVASDAATCFKYLSQKDFPNCISLDANLVLHWRTVDNTTLELAPDADGYLSWLALGISEAGTKGVDFNVVIRGTQGMSWVMGDYFTTANYTLMPTLDVEQNAVLTVAPDFDTDNHTLAVWQRPLDSCDDEDVPIFLGVERSLVWAYSYRSDWDLDKARFSTFTRGLLPGLKLYAPPAAAAPPLDPAAATATLAMPAFPVPPANSTVACVHLPLPNATAFHVTAYAGFNATRLLHHLAGYICAPGVLQPPPPGAGVAYMCGPGQTLLPPGCETLAFVWAPGAGVFTAPPEAGFAMGAGRGSVLVLQAHYQNPAGAVGQVDSSGFNITYTPSLRNASLGVLTLGNADLRIPPATDRYTALPNICPASCTGQRVLQPVTLVSSFFLLGRLGVSVMTRHIRGGAAIQPVGRINYWDAARPTYQGAFPNSTALLPNDTLISLCSYDSSGIPRATTFSGLGPAQELCFNYLTFFPASAMPDLDYCVADTRKNISTCATRTALARMAAVKANDTVQLMNGTKVAVGTLNISLFRSEQCLLHDQIDVTPYHEPNTKAAVASSTLVPIVLVIVGFLIYSKYSKQEELEALLAEARREGLASQAAD